MITRKLYKFLKSHLSQKEITLLVGPRQSGKTTLLKLLESDLRAKKECTLFFNLDIEEDRHYFTSQRSLLKKIELEIGKKHGFVFIDEIQRKENAGLFLKGLYDMNLPYKFLVSGSGSLELKEKIHESLAGRKRVFELSSLTFEEFVQYKTAYRYTGRLLDFFDIEKAFSRDLLMEYLRFGGYPRVVLEKTAEGKRLIMNEIYESYLQKDASYILRIEKTEDFSHLAKILSSQIGNLVNVSELSRLLRISEPTVKNYLWYLEKTFVLQRITPSFQNVRKEIVKSPVFYFYDLGLRNFLVNRFDNLQNMREIGFVFENFVYLILKEVVSGTASTIHYWRTKLGAEVDFIIHSGEEKIPVEVKYQELSSPAIPRSLASYIEKYKPRRAYVINLSLNAQRKVGETEVCFVDCFRLHSVIVNSLSLRGRPRRPEQFPSVILR